MDLIDQIKASFEQDFKWTFKEDAKSLSQKYLGRKGSINQAFNNIPGADLEARKASGKRLNDLKLYIENRISSIDQKSDWKDSAVDLTLPPLSKQYGRLHPLTSAEKELEEIFESIGFGVEETPEIETDWYNFGSLNFQPFHPARDMQDTFYISRNSPSEPKKDDIILRTHISTVQSRSLEKYKPPFAKISFGRVYRNEATDASHEHTYNEIEGLAVGENVTFGSMVWTLDYVMKKFFGQNVKTRLLPSYFPFTEPSAEMGISCLNCRGRGCSVCKHTGWVELLGCGMTHQNVYQNLGYKKGQLQGFAFGMGSSRLALMKYKIPDIRLFSENSLQFLEQF